MTFRELLDEGKQVGTIYHFTKPENILSIIDKNRQSQFGLDVLEFMSHNGHFSTTRNSSLTTDFTHPTFSVKNNYIIRISLDGTKLSNKYKIKPILGLNDNDFDIFKNSNDRVPKKWGENEEVIMGNDKLKFSSTFKLKDFINQIDIYNKSGENVIELKKDIESFLSKSNISIPVNIVRHFVDIKNTNKVKLNENYSNIYDCKYLSIISEENK